MAMIDVRNGTIDAKIVYYGPGLSGKTTNLLNIHARLPQGARGEMRSIETDAERTLFFDFVPIEPIRVGGWQVRFHLYSVPGQETYVRTRRAILGGADGVVFVADADESRLDADRASLEELREHFRHYQRTPDDVPIVIQYNKIDLPSAGDRQRLEQSLNPDAWPSFAAIATRGNGVAETLTAISKAVARTL